MTFQVRINCLICRKLTDTAINSEEGTKAEALNLIQSNLCLALKLQFSPKFREWDFAEEPFPYCESCGQRLQRLGELIDQLKSIEEELNRSLATVSALVITSDKNYTNTTDPPLVTPKLGQLKEYFRSLQEKHSYFRSLIIQRFDPRVIVERCNDPSHYPALSFDVYEYELVPKNIAIKTEPAIQAFPDTAAEEAILNGTEYKVDTSTIDTSRVDPDTIIGMEESCPSLTQAPVLSLALNPVENPASAKYPGSVKSEPSTPNHVTFDEASKTYELDGFKFKELENGSYECSTCGHVSVVSKGKISKRNRNIKRHIQTVHMRVPRFDHRQGSWPCDECGKLCTTLKILYAHRANVHRSPRFQCGHCGAKFPFRGRLRRHVLTHKEQRGRPYSCDECDKRFFSNAHLKVHSSVHTNKRPEQCSRCSAKFKTQNALQKHFRRVHDKD